MGDEETRSLRPLPDTGNEPMRRGRNIVAVIGIDDYVAWRKLHNAVSDAKGMRTLFVERLGFRELLPPLLDAAATLQTITSLLQDELSTKLEPDDSLVLFFAGHGHTESSQIGSKTVKTGYLIPFEARLPQEHKFSTYIKLDSFLRDVARLPARHVLVILDACYSGFALGETVQVLRSHERYSDDLSRRLSRRVITSAMDDQPALDNGPIAGHSLFTGTLVEGIDSGEADGENKGFVTSSELALFVQMRVGSASQSKQTPDFGSFELDDRGELVISLRGETFNKAQARECLEVANSLYDLGWIADDPKRFQSAIREHRKSLEFAGLAKMAFPEAELGLGKALFASGDPASAIKFLSELIRREEDLAPAEARLYLGLAHAKQGHPAEAAAALQDWKDRNPGHRDAQWVGAYIAWLRRGEEHPQSGKRALLIGINQYSLQGAIQLQGCVNDVENLMRPLLMRWAFNAEDIVLLTDRSANRESVLGELERLARESGPDDTVFVHYSGHAVPSSRPDIFGPNDKEGVYLILHDTNTALGYLSNGISASELHQSIEAIPAHRKTLVLDTHASDQLVNMAEQEGTYALILASDTAEIAYEWSVEVDGNRLTCGMLTGALHQAGMQLPTDGFTYDQWVEPAIRISQDASSNAVLYPNRQTPLFVGQKEWSVLGGEDLLLPLFEFSQRRQWPEMTAGQLMKRYRFFLQSIEEPHPQANLAFGRAFLFKGEYPASVEALNRATAQLGRDNCEVLMPLLRAHLCTGEFAKAREVCQRMAAVGTADEKAAIPSLLSRIDALAGSRRHAVLVGINRYCNRKLPGLKGAVNDANAMQKILVGRWGFKPEDVTLLCDQVADRETILAEFKRLVTLSRDETAVFYFAGLGSTDASRLPTIVSHDGRTRKGSDISVKELAELAGEGASNLVVILDAGFGFGPLWATVERTIQPDDRSFTQQSPFHNDEDRRRFMNELRIGTLFILHAPDPRYTDFQFGVPRDSKMPEAETTLLDEPQAVYHGQLTAVLVRCLERTDSSTTVFADVIRQLNNEWVEKDVSIRASAEALPRPVLASAAHFEVMQRAIELERAPLRKIIALLKRAIDQRQKAEDYWPEGRLNAGIAFAVSGDYEQARRLLDETVDIFEGRGPLEGERAI